LPRQFSGARKANSIAFLKIVQLYRNLKHRGPRSPGWNQLASTWGKLLWEGAAVYLGWAMGLAQPEAFAGEPPYIGLTTPSRKSLSTRRKNLVSPVDRFPFKVPDVVHCPDPFRDSLRRAVTPTDNVTEIITVQLLSAERLLCLAPCCA